MCVCCGCGGLHIGMSVCGVYGCVWVGLCERDRESMGVPSRTEAGNKEEGRGLKINLRTYIFLL